MSTAEIQRDFDLFFNEMGYEALDVSYNIERLELKEDEEFKQIDKEWENKIQEFIEARKSENEKMRARAEELRADKNLKILKDAKYDKMVDYEDAEEAI